MNKLFRNILAVVAAVAFSFTNQAATATYGPETTALTSVIGVPASISSIVFANGATNSVSLTLTDSPTNTLTYLTSAYTNSVTTTGSTVTTYTNILGVIQSMTNTTSTRSLSVQGALTNNYRTFLTVVVPASGSYVWTPSIPQPVLRGLAISSTATNVTASITYQPVR
jgi:hypothetical protein